MSSNEGMIHSEFYIFLYYHNFVQNEATGSAYFMTLVKLWTPKPATLV